MWIGGRGVGMRVSGEAEEGGGTKGVRFGLKEP